MVSSSARPSGLISSEPESKSPSPRLMTRPCSMCTGTLLGELHREKSTKRLLELAQVLSSFSTTRTESRGSPG